MVILIIGLTGGIASGKSTVARMLRDRGARVLDADRLAGEAMLPGKPAWREIVAWLGQSFLKEDGTIDRDRLGRLVFGDAAARRKLNQIVHPRVGQALLARTKELRQTDPAAVLVYDVPLLIEAGMQDTVDLVLLVYVTPETQLLRLQGRDNLSREEALSRMRAQMPLEEKKKYAHRVIDNNGSLEETARQVDRFWQRLKPAGRR